MAKKQREAADMGAMVRRVLRSLTTRAFQGDMDALVELDRCLETARLETGAAALLLREMPWSYSWTDIGNALGVSRQAAQQRFGVTGETKTG